MGKDCHTIYSRAEAMISWMRKHYHCLLHVAEGEMGGCLGVSFDMPRIAAKGSSDKKILHVVIKNYITKLT